ncbi:MAG: DUF1080 domain-containing protein [Tannerella sp.]|jgi:hypothetical protein|nr:DUF1080 domain-containing protein [Tannerella sp.]
MNRFNTLALIFAVVATPLCAQTVVDTQSVAQSLTNLGDQPPKAVWIWHPGDFEIWLGNRVQKQRTEREAFYAPFWRADHHASLVRFMKTVELDEAETIDIHVEGEFSVRIDDRLVYEEHIRKLLIPQGKHSIIVQVYNAETPPSILVQGKTIVSDKSWTISRQAGTPVKADAWIFDSPDTKPSDYKLARKLIEPVKTVRRDESVTVDFGRETFGYLKLNNLRGTGTLTAYYGESEEEAASPDAETRDVFHINQAGDLADNIPRDLDHNIIHEVTQNTTHDYTVSPPVTTTATTLSYSAKSRDFISDRSRAFRYVRFTWTGDVGFDDVSMFYEFNPLQYKGSFSCDDDEINRIWITSAYTLHLSSREFFIDGIKRDRWVWSGDAYQSYLMNYYLFFDNPLVKRTTWALRGNDPVETHINTILDYTFYWFMGIYDYYLYTGDRELLQQIYPKMLSLMDFCIARRNREGLVEGLPGDWVFIDWAPIDKEGEVSVEQLLFCRSLETMTLCAEIVNDHKNAELYRQLASQLQSKIISIYWDKSQKALVHGRKNGVLDRKVTKYANMFALNFGYLDAQQQEDVKQNVLLNDAIQKITTPYMRFYELEALCRIKQQHHVLSEIKDYWGGMLRLGATSFWEAFDPEQSGAEHYAMYDRPFGRSLCHAWGASPIYLFGKYWLGVCPTSPGYATYLIEPELGGLKWMTGSVPTPSGNINLSVTEKKITVETVSGAGTLRFRSRTKPSCKTGKITLSADGYYEMKLEANSKYEVGYAVATATAATTSSSTSSTSSASSQDVSVPEILRTHRDKAQFTKLKDKVKLTSLFNGKNFDGWYIYSQGSGVNNDIEKAFNVENGLIHLAGETMGYLCTNKSYKNYYLRVVFRWGDKKYPPRQNTRRDSGILYHFPLGVTDKIWPKSIECQVQEEDCGDYWCVDGATADSPNESRIEGGVMKHIIRTDNFENPGQEWNTIEIICIDNKSEHYVNGHLVNQAHNLTVAEGKILLQLECAEVFYKTVEILSLK